MINQIVHRGKEGLDAFLSRFIAGTTLERTLLVCKAHSFEASGARELFAPYLEGRVPQFSDFSPNPKIEDVLRGLDAYKAIKPDRIVAVGGGSVLDMAKLINHFGRNHVEPEAYLDNPDVIKSTSLSPLLAVPTTSGSGSEATRFAVLYRGKEKCSIEGSEVLPSHVLLIPELTCSMSTYQTACTGIDALAQGIEACWAKAATGESQNYGKQAILLALDHLTDAVHAPNIHNRTGMQESAYLAGKAINISKTTAPHAFSYILTSTFDLPHGHAVGLLLPFFVNYHAASGMAIEGVTSAGLHALLRKNGLEKKLPMSSNDLYDLLASNVNQDRLSNNPVQVEITLIRNIAESLAGEGPK